MHTLYLEFSVIMSLVKLRSLSDYWSNHHILNCMTIAGRITRDRYQNISRYLYFVDNDKLSCRDRQVDVLRWYPKQFRTAYMYTLNRDVAIDEAMIRGTQHTQMLRTYVCAQ